MKSIYFKSLFILLFVFVTAANLTAQSLDIFGYSQSMYQDNWVSSSDGASKSHKNSFYQQQTNLFLSKRFDNSFSSFLNLEMENNFDSQAGFGSISLEEAWLRYRYNKAFSIKMGKLIPEYAGFNTIRNRTPLLNFASRPLIYEKLYRELLADSPDFYPEFAFLQINGRFDLSDKLSLKYSAFAGNGDEMLITSSNGPKGSLAQSGSDTTTTIMVGGRVGLEYADFDLGIFSLGFSSSWDEAYIPRITEDSFYPILAAGGYQPLHETADKAPRVRYAIDFNAELNKFNIRAEYYKVYNDLSDKQMATLDDYDQTLQALLGFSSRAAKKSQTSWFVLGSYNLTHEWYVSASVSAYQVDNQRFYDKPLMSYTGGIGYRKGPIVLKSEYRVTSADNKNYVSSDIDNILTSKTLYFTAGFTF